MKSRNALFSLILLLDIVLTACGGAPTPDALFPDVIEWDELRTRRRQESIYYGIKNFVRKMTGALAIFIALQALGWFGYQAPPEGTTFFQQSPPTLMAIRILIGPSARCCSSAPWRWPGSTRSRAKACPHPQAAGEEKGTAEDA